MNETSAAIYLRRLTEAARLSDIPVIQMEAGNEESLRENAERISRNNQSGSVFWLGYVPDYNYYEKVSSILSEFGLHLLNLPEEFSRAQYFDQYYPHIKEVSVQSHTAYSAEEAVQCAIETGFPVFMKGAVQSLKSKGWSRCIANHVQEAEDIAKLLLAKHDFSEGKIIVRKFVPLMHRAIGAGGIPQAHEYRFFLYRAQVVDFSYYWEGKNPFTLSGDEETALRRLAEKTARSIGAPFISLDIAQAESGQWLVIEAGDGQFSGIRSIPPLRFWNALKELVR